MQILDWIEDKVYANKDWKFEISPRVAIALY